jgi:heat shock protein HslJ
VGVVKREHAVRPVCDARDLATLFASGLVLVAAGALLLGVAMTTAGCGASGDEETESAPRASAPPQQPGGLWGRKFTSTVVTEAGVPRPLVPGTRISLAFEKSKGRRTIGWSAGCNQAGAKVRVTADELQIGQIASTLIGCPANLQDQDEWLGEFFDSNPRWRLSDSQLMLSSGETVIELKVADHSVP